MPRRKFISGVSDRGSDIVDAWTRQLDRPQNRWSLSGALALAPARSFVPAWETTVGYTKWIRSVASFALDRRSDHPARWCTFSDLGAVLNDVRFFEGHATVSAQGAARCHPHAATAV